LISFEYEKQNVYNYSEQVELKRVLQILLRRKWIAIQAFLVIFLTAVVGTFLLKPIYETTAKLWFKPPTVTPSLLASIGMKEIGAFVPSGPTEVDIGSKLILTQVYPLLEKVIYRLQVRDDDGNLLTPDKLIKSSLLYMIFPAPFISVVQDTNSNTITITARSTDVDQATFLSNTLAEVYIEDSETDRKKETQSARIFLDGQIVKVKEDYNKALNDILTFQDKRNTVNLEIETKIAIEKMAELMKQKEDNIIDLSETREKIKTLKTQLGKTSISGQTSLSVPILILKENPQIQKIMEDLSQLRSKLASELTDKTLNHPDVIALKQQITELENDLEKEVQINQVTSSELSDLERQLAALQVHLDGVNMDINKYTGLIKTLPAKSNEEAKLKLALTASQDIYSSLLDYSNRIGVAEAMTLPDAVLAQPALRPYKPTIPNIILNVIIGAFLGLFFAFGLAFIAEYIDDTVKTPEDIEPYKELCFLGSAPQIKAQKLIAAMDVNDPVSEAYRAIRYGIRYASLDKPVKSFIITSSRPKEGKTLTAANLGISFSQTGLKVILVDTDLRRPYLHELFQKTNQAGLTKAIAGECTLEEAITDTGIEGLSLLPSGPIPPDPGRIFESEKLKEFIMFLKKIYDIVILDSAPLLIKSDAAVLARYVDGIIYVIEAKKTTKRAITETTEVLKKANLRLLGAILNKYGKKKAYYRYPQEKKKRSILRKIFFITFLMVLITSMGCSSSSNQYLNPNIKEYLKNLKSSNIIIQREAVNKLGLLQIKDAVPEMIRLLEKGSVENAPFIIEALGKIEDKAAVSPLIAMLGKDNVLIREKAIEALGKIGDKRAVPALIPVLEQKDNRTEGEVFTAIWALGNIGDKSAEPVLTSLLGDNNKYVRYNVEQALKKIHGNTDISSENVPVPGEEIRPEYKVAEKTQDNEDVLYDSNAFPAAFQTWYDIDEETARWINRLKYDRVIRTDSPPVKAEAYHQDHPVQADSNPLIKSADDYTPALVQRASYRVSPTILHQNQIIDLGSSMSDSIETKGTTIEDRIYNFDELPSSVKQDLPNLFISVFIYSDDASSRMARVNGQMMREGEYLTAGLKLEKITLDEIIFSYKSYRFHIRPG
jgi:succinoglycan biosynthesis transport protein ExoP